MINLIQDDPVFLDIAQDKAIEYAPLLVGAAATLVLGWIGTKIVTGIVRRVLTKAKMESTLVGFLCNATNMALMTFVIVATLGRLGVETGSFVAILAAAGFAIGFALQGSLGNLAAGVMIIFFRPFKAGDFVEAGGAMGVVENVGIFATVFRTADNKRVIVANGSITSGNITNYSANPTRRVDMVFGVSYGDDIKKAKALLQEIVEQDERVLKEPAPIIAVSELGDSSVNFVVRPWVNTADYWAVFFATHEAVKLRFDAQGISIPFPQRDVHLHQVA